MNKGADETGGFLIIKNLLCCGGGRSAGTVLCCIVYCAMILLCAPCACPRRWVSNWFQCWAEEESREDAQGKGDDGWRSGRPATLQASPPLLCHERKQHKFAHDWLIGHMVNGGALARPPPLAEIYIFKEAVGKFHSRSAQLFSFFK